MAAAGHRQRSSATLQRRASQPLAGQSVASSAWCVAERNIPTRVAITLARHGGHRCAAPQVISSPGPKPSEASTNQCCVQGETKSITVRLHSLARRTSCCCRCLRSLRKLPFTLGSLILQAAQLFGPINRAEPHAKIESPHSMGDG